VIAALIVTQLITSSAPPPKPADAATLRRASPDLVEGFEAMRPTILTPLEATTLADLYSRIPVSSFSDEVLSWRPWEFAVLRCENLGWSDLGETHRVLSVLERKGAKPDWAFQHAPGRSAAG